MQINRHGSFYIRNGWPTKILDALAVDPHIFSPNSELTAVDTIGVGRVMIKAMRYWATVLGIANEGKHQQGICHTFTELARLIEQWDPFCNDIGTLWLLHRNLARNMEDATAWSWAFNCYEESSFTKNDFSTAFYAFLQRNGMSYNKGSVEKEFDCFKNTYVSDEAFSVTKIIEEDTVPFFAPLKLLEYKGNGRFERLRTSAKTVSPYVFLACVLMDNAEHLVDNRQIGLDHLLEEQNQVCKYMNLTYSSLVELLQQLENERYLRLVNNFGNRYIELGDIDAQDLLQKYYRENGAE